MGSWLDSSVNFLKSGTQLQKGLQFPPSYKRGIEVGVLWEGFPSSKSLCLKALSKDQLQPFKRVYNKETDKNFPKCQFFCFLMSLIYPLKA